MAKDPVCGMTVNEEIAKYASEYKGKKYYFFAPGCKMSFEENPRNI
jgi:YHS domain-containing protein